MKTSQYLHRSHLVFAIWQPLVGFGVGSLALIIFWYYFIGGLMESQCDTEGFPELQLVWMGPNWYLTHNLSVGFRRTFKSFGGIPGTVSSQLFQTEGPTNKKPSNCLWSWNLTCMCICLVFDHACCENVWHTAKTRHLEVRAFPWHYEASKRPKGTRVAPREHHHFCDRVCLNEAFGNRAREVNKKGKGSTLVGLRKLGEW